MEIQSAETIQTAPATEAESQTTPIGASLRLELFVADLDAFADFYTRVLGFTVAHDKRRDSPPSPYITVRRDAVRIAGAPADAPVDKEMRSIPTGVEIVLEVDDLDAERRRVVDAGWPLSDDAQLRPWGLTDFRVHDPDGYYVRITNRYQRR
jgi:lactoylglutathione lyase